VDEVGYWLERRAEALRAGTALCEACCWRERLSDGKSFCLFWNAGVQGSRLCPAFDPLPRDDEVDWDPETAYYLRTGTWPL